MSASFSANQYDGAFVSHRVQNWEVPMKHKKATWFNDHYQSGRPSTQAGFTQIISNDRGHIEECNMRSEKNPWGDFVGTWDMPTKIPGNCATVQTARCPDAQDQLKRHMARSNVVILGQQKNCTRQNKQVLSPVDVPADAQASTMLEQERLPSACGGECRSRAEASPGPVKTPNPVPEYEC